MNLDRIYATGSAVRDIVQAELSSLMHAVLKKIHGVDQYVIPENNRRAGVRKERARVSGNHETLPKDLVPLQYKTNWDFGDSLSTIVYWDDCFSEIFLTRTTLDWGVQQDLTTTMHNLMKRRNRFSHTAIEKPTEKDLLYFCLDSEQVLRAVGVKDAADRVDEIRAIAFGQIPMHVKHITDPDDDDLFAIWELQQRDFSDEVADDYHEMQRWIREIKTNYAQKGDGKFNDIMLALKLQDNVIGYLYAQHYVNRQIIFISYLGYDENVVEARQGIGPTELLKKLVELCKSARPWKAIVAEVEQLKRGRNDNSRQMFVRFKRYERKLQELLGTSGKLFILDFDYIQPAAKPIDVGKNPTDAQIQRLLFFARDVNSLDKTPTGKYVLPGNEAVKLLDAVISCVYGDAYRDDEEYQKHLRDTLASYRPSLERGVSLTDK